MSGTHFLISFRMLLYMLQKLFYGRFDFSGMSLERSFDFLIGRKQIIYFLGLNK